MNNFFIPKQIVVGYQHHKTFNCAWISRLKDNKPISKYWNDWCDPNIQENVYPNQNITITFTQSTVDMLQNDKTEGLYYFTDNYGNITHIEKRQVLLLLANASMVNGKITNCVYAFKRGRLYILPVNSNLYLQAKKE